MQDELEARVAEFLGPRYAGRRFLRYAELRELGLVNNRETLNLWVLKGAFPRGLKIPGSHGKVLVWHVPEIVRLIAQRMAERDASPQSEEAAPVMGAASNDSHDPVQTGRNDVQQQCVYPAPRY